MKATNKQQLKAFNETPTEDQTCSFTQQSGGSVLPCYCIKQFSQREEQDEKQLQTKLFCIWETNCNFFVCDTETKGKLGTQHNTHRAAASWEARELVPACVVKVCGGCLLGYGFTFIAQIMQVMFAVATGRWQSILSQKKKNIKTQFDSPSLKAMMHQLEVWTM